MKPPLQTPVPFGHWLVVGDTAECRLPRKTVTVRAPRKLLAEVSRLCDGTRPWPEVIESLGKTWSPGTVASFMLALCKEGVLVESGQLWAHWSEIAQLPQPGLAQAGPEEIAMLPSQAEERLLPGAGIVEEGVRSGTNPIAATLRLRESFRTFDDRPLTLQVLCSILWAAHGVARASESETLRWHRTAASGGNMHSARWFVAVLRDLPSDNADHADISPGVYEARFHTGGGASLQPVGPDGQMAWACLRDPRVLRFASALVLPIYDVAVPARKYGNRATLFATLEAGLCLQNAQLMSASLGAACMLRGDTVASAAIRLSGVQEEGHHWLSLPGMVVGAMPSHEQKRSQELECRFKIAPNLRPKVDDNSPTCTAHFAFAAAPAEKVNRHVLAGSGRACDPRTALSIAEAEAWERLGWAELGDTILATFRDLPHTLDPRELVAYSARQHRSAGFPFPRFDPAREYLWRQAVQVETGVPSAVPVECVHALHALPASFQANACTSSSTSGVAAGANVEDALARATLELVERDAFCCAWLSGAAQPGIDPKSLPAELRGRLSALADEGAHASFIDLSNRWCAVIAVFLQSASLPFTAVTAAAAFDADAAADKALSEAEGRLAFAQHLPVDETPDDAMRAIERYYRSPRTYRRSDFLRPEQYTRRHTDVARGSARTWEQMRSQLRADGFDLLCADITPPGAAIEQGRRPLKVVRALVPGLVPIWFHRGVQPGGLQRFIQADRVLKGRPAGHFIHPFT